MIELANPATGYLHVTTGITLAIIIITNIKFILCHPIADNVDALMK